MSNISLIARIEEKMLMQRKLKYMDSEEKTEEFILKKSTAPQELPSFFFKSRKIDGLDVYTFGDENNSKAVLYMHGGAYIGEINNQHLLYCLMLSRKAGVYVVAPVYPLAPNHKSIECHDAIEGLYEKLVEDHETLIVMGDSAGGGFAFSFCQYLKTIELPQPDKIIAFSPWVDVSMSNPPYDCENDPILGEIGLKGVGKSWAGDLDVKDYRVSPLFGDNEGLADALIFAGTNEIFYKDIEKYVENLKNDGVDVKFITGEGMFHIYPLFPSPEARNALNLIKNEIE